MPSLPLESLAIVAFVAVIWTLLIYGFAVVFPRILAFLERF